MVIFLAVETAREGREGRRVGTMFVVGELIAEIVPERFLLRGHCLHVESPYSLGSDESTTVVCRAEREEEVS
jgi:hypothetical protein